MAFFCYLRLQGVTYLHCDFFLIEKMHLFLRRVHVNIHRPRIYLQAAPTVRRVARSNIETDLRYTKGETPLGSMPV